MKRIIGMFLLVYVVLCFVGCEAGYEVTLLGEYDLVDELKDTYKEGEQVVINLWDISDGYYKVYLDGVEVPRNDESRDLESTCFKFTMPNKSVEVKIEFISANKSYVPDSRLGTSLLKGWTGDFSVELYENTINNYKKTCKNNPFDANIFSFESEVEVAEASVVYLSTVDDSDINNELKGYIDLYVPITSEDRTIKIDIGCLARGGAVKVLTPEGSMIPIAPDSLVNGCKQELDDKVWSYLVRVLGTDDIERYYYFRVDYSLRVAC